MLLKKGFPIGQHARAADRMRRREFIALLGGAAAGWPLAARAQQTGRGTLLKYLVEFSGVAITYLAVAKLSLALASVHPSATPIWPPTGFALADVLLLGYRIWPAIFLAAFIANATTAGSTYTSLAIATGNTLESAVGAYLINRWSDGVGTFDTPTGVARFALICFMPSTMISATLGVVSLSLSGYADWADFASIWMTWWMGDLAGALVITPVILLWTTSFPRSRQSIPTTTCNISPPRMDRLQIRHACAQIIQQRQVHDIA